LFFATEEKDWDTSNYLAVYRIDTAIMELNRGHT